MSDWKQGFYEAVKAYCGLPEDAVIDDIHENAPNQWQTGCDTCGYGADEGSIEVHYSTPQSKYNSLTIEGENNLADFIRSL